MDIFFGPPLYKHYAADPLTLIDIGARGGLQPNWEPARRHLRVIGFEPDPAEHARLTAGADPRRTHYINTALHQRPASLTLNVGRAEGTSSLLEPNLEFLRRFPDSRRYEVVDRIPVRADTLDRSLAAHDVSDPDFIKIDTQGAELPILEGSRETLRSVFGAEVEVLLAPLYRDQTPFGDIDAFLRGVGFQLFDLRPSYWKRTAGALYGGPKGQLVFADALYLKTEESVQRQLEAIEKDGPGRGSKLLRMLSICLLYGYLDLAIELFEPNRGLLDRDVAERVASELRSQIPLSARLPHFRGRGWLSNFFYRMHRALFPTVGGWASGGRNIGNLE